MSQSRFPQHRSFSAITCGSFSMSFTLGSLTSSLALFPIFSKHVVISNSLCFLSPGPTSMCVSGDLFSPHGSLTPVVLVVMSMTLAVVVVEVFPAVLHSQHSEFLVHSFLLVSYLLSTLFSILTSGVTLFVARSSISV